MRPLPPKLCPICRKHFIKNWESACLWCWRETEQHDREFGTKWCEYLIILNYIREECRQCGLDPINGA